MRKDGPAELFKAFYKRLNSLKVSINNRMPDARRKFDFASDLLPQLSQLDRRLRRRREH
jgi:hypothetical protein